MFPAVQNLSPERAALLQARLVHTNARNLNYMPTLAGIGNWSDTDLQILHQKHPELFNAFHGAALRQLEKTSQASLKQNLSSQPIRSAPSADSVRILSIYQSARTTHHRELMILAGGLPRSYIAKVGKILRIRTAELTLEQVKGELITMESKWEVIISMLGHGWQASEVQKKSTHFAAEVRHLTQSRASRS